MLGSASTFPKASMVHMVRPLCMLLAALIALAGGTFDLCGCDGDVHGRLCAEAELPAPEAGCCGPHDCRAAETRVEPAGPQLRAVGCECPVVQLAASPAEPTPPPSVTAATTDLAKVLRPDVPASVLLVEDADLEATSARSPPPEPGGVRRHLLLKVIRC